MWYLGWHFEATTDYLLQTLGQARRSAISILNVIPQKYGCGRVVSIMATVIKPENEIWPINFEDGCINKIDAAAAAAACARNISDAGDILLIEFLLFFPASPTARRGRIWIYNWQLFFRLAHLIRPSLPFMSYVCAFLSDSPTSEMWFNSGLKWEKRHANIKLLWNINENVDIDMHS